MTKGKDILRRLARDEELQDQPLPGLPIVELAGNRRVLIENHRGVREYSRERIGVKVKSGMVVVCGQGLELSHMTKQQLVIQGTIEGIRLEGRG